MTDKYRLEVSDFTVYVYDTRNSVTYERWDGTVGKKEDVAAVISMCHMAYCCGISELGGFDLRKKYNRDESIKDLIATGVAELVKKSKSGLTFASFVKIGKAEKFNYQWLMDRLLKIGFEKVGEPFKNRRYRSHLIQTLMYRNPKSVVEKEVQSTLAVQEISNGEAGTV